MNIIDVNVYRDGGTIVLKVADDIKSGDYVLPTPFQKEPRHIYWNNEALPIGSPAETEFLTKLNGWWKEHATDVIESALHEFDLNKRKQGLSQPILNYLYIRTVIQYLEARSDGTH